MGIVHVMSNREHGGEGHDVSGTSRVRAAMALLLLALTAVAAVAFSRQPGPLGAAVAEGESDVSLHSAVVGRLERGENYYDVTGDELRRRGYPTRSVFNWRSPLLFSAVALAPRLHGSF